MCIGCQRHFVRLGCPAHDPNERITTLDNSDRRTPRRNSDLEDSQTTKGSGTSSVASSQSS